MDAWVICAVLISKGESRQGVQKARRYTQTIGDSPWIHFHRRSIFEGDKVLECWKSEFKSGCRVQRWLFVIVFRWQPSVCTHKADDASVPARFLSELKSLKMLNLLELRRRFFLLWVFIILLVCRIKASLVYKYIPKTNREDNWNFWCPVVQWWIDATAVAEAEAMWLL